MVPRSVGSSRRRDLIAGAVAPAAALVAYLPVLVVPYAYMDDYFVLGWRRGLGGSFFTTAASFGRPLHAVALWGGFSLASDVASLRLVRLVALLGVMVLAALLFYALRQEGHSRWVAVGVCLTVVTLASFQVYVSWAAVGEAPYVAALGGLAYLLLRPTFGRRDRRSLVRRAAAAAVLLAALLTYQPVAMFFWVFAAIDAFGPGEPLARAARKLAESAVVAGVAIFFAYAAVRIGVHFWGGATAGRTNLVHDVVGKARWFWNEPIVNGFGMFGLLPTATLAVGMAIVAGVGILRLHADAGRGAFGFLGLAAALVPLSYLPNLAVSENFASYRSIGALAALLALYVWLGLSGLARAANCGSAARVVALAVAVSFAVVALVVVPLAHPQTLVSRHALTGAWELAAFAALCAVAAAAGLRRRRPAWIAAVAVGAFAVAAVVIAARNVTTLVVEPQSIELEQLRTKLGNSAEPAHAAHILFVKPNYTPSPAPLQRYDELGLPSTYFYWVPDPAARLTLKDLHRRSNASIEVVAWDVRVMRRPGEGLVDMRTLGRRHVGWSVWTLHSARTNVSVRRR
jgi:hypothetical protein